jgi:heptosyltransferase-1
VRPFPPFLQRALAEQGRNLTLVVVRLAAMGDVLRTLPAVRLLRRGLGAAQIYWVVDDRWRLVLDRHPDLTGLVSFPRREWQRRSDPGGARSSRMATFLRFRAALRAVKPDLTLDFHGSLRSGVTGWLSGAPIRLGYAGHQQKELNRWFNTHHCDSGPRRTPRMERNLELVRALGLPDRPLPTGALPLAGLGREEALRMRGAVLRGAAAFAVVSPGASESQSYKKLPVPIAVAACKRLTASGVTPLVVWGPGEETDAAAVASGPESGAILAPPTDLATLAGLLAQARLFVGGDSGPLHMACAVGSPVVGIYGPTDPLVNRPWGVPYRTVSPEGRVYTGVKRLDREAGGFQGLSADQVESAVLELLEETADRTVRSPA